MNRVLVDFSSLVRDGLLKASQRRASEPLVLGGTVEVYDPDEPDMVFDAEVVELDGSGRVLLRVAWEPVAEAAAPAQSWHINVGTVSGGFPVRPRPPASENRLSGWVEQPQNSATGVLVSA